MNFQFYGYTVRQTTLEDEALARRWTDPALDPAFWLKQGNGRESFLVSLDSGLRTDLAFFQVEHRWATQVRLHFQASPVASPKKILRGITKLIPLIEKALALRGVRAIFFTSHSLAMVAFMEKRGYRLQPNIDGGADGVVMAKGINVRA